jgi:predicted transcriptional regulator
MQVIPAPGQRRTSAGFIRTKILNALLPTGFGNEMKQLFRGQQLLMTIKKDVPIRVIYRDPIYIRKDILMKLYEYGELNQSRLVSYCNLNNTKHRQIIVDLVEKGMITKAIESWGNKVFIKHRVSKKGRKLLREINLPYEELFPRVDSGNLNIMNLPIPEKA